MAFSRRGDYDVIVVVLDRLGLLLALFLKFGRTWKSIVLICHGEIMGRYSLRTLRYLNLKAQFSRFICYGPAIAMRLRAALGLTALHVVHINHPADHKFWLAQGPARRRSIVNEGAWRRDYATLVRAVDGLDVGMVIAASSP